MERACSTSSGAALTSSFSGSALNVKSPFSNDWKEGSVGEGGFELYFGGTFASSSGGKSYLETGVARGPHTTNGGINRPRPTTIL